MASLTLSTEDAGDIRVLVLEGQVDDRGARELQNALTGALTEGRRGLLLDLTRLEGIAGSGLRVLVSFAGRIGGEGGALGLCCLRPDVEKVLEMAGLHRSLDVYRDRASAWQGLRETVRRRRISRLAGRLMRDASVVGRIVMRTHVDRRRAAFAAQLIGTASGEGEEHDPSVSG